MRRNIGLRLQTLPDPPREALAKAAALKMDGVEIPCAEGELSPRELDRSGRRHLLHYLRDLELAIASLHADFGFRFDQDHRVEMFFDRTREVIEMAIEMGTGLVTTALGPIPEDQQSALYRTMGEILTDLGYCAANGDCRLAVSSGFEPTEVLQRFLDALNNDGLAVNYDPANMLFNSRGPVESVAPLGNYIVQVRARDGSRFLDGSVEERSLGQGDVPFDDVVDALDDIDFHGFFIIARQLQPDPEAEIEKARKFLERY